MPISPPGRGRWWNAQPSMTVSARHSGTTSLVRARRADTKMFVPMRAKFGQREVSDPTLAWNFLTSKQPVLDDWFRCNRGKTDDRQTPQDIKGHQGDSSRSAIWAGTSQTLRPDRSRSSSRRSRREVRRIALLFENKKARAGGWIEGGSQQRSVRHTLPDECQGPRFALSPACFFRPDGLPYAAGQSLGGARGILLPIDRFSRNRRVASALRHVGVCRARDGRSHRSDGHRQCDDRLNQRWWTGSMRRRSSQAGKVPRGGRKRRHPGAVLG